jgi:N-methylhydantoinase B/oxoprolinase/acetone carboxylase alpha subunit
MSDRQRIAPWGLFGGQGGGKAELLFQRAGSDQWLTISQAFNKPSPSKFANVPLHPGDRLRIVGPAGGGWGPPSERNPELVAEDVREGWVSPERARSAYGYSGK